MYIQFNKTISFDSDQPLEMGWKLTVSAVGVGGAPDRVFIHQIFFGPKPGFSGSESDYTGVLKFDSSAPGSTLTGLNIDGASGNTSVVGALKGDTIRASINGVLETREITSVSVDFMQNIST